MRKMSFVHACLCPFSSLRLLQRGKNPQTLQKKKWENNHQLGYTNKYLQGVDANENVEPLGKNTDFILILY